MDAILKFRARWRADLQRFQRHCEAGGPEDQSVLIREGSHLFADVSQALGIRLPTIGEYALEAHLMLRAYESAVVALLGPDTTYMVSKGGGMCFASVVLPGQEHELSAVGDTVALAMLSATALALLSIADDR